MNPSTVTQTGVLQIVTNIKDYLQEWCILATRGLDCRRRELLVNAAGVGTMKRNTTAVFLLLAALLIAIVPATTAQGLDVTKYVSPSQQAHEPLDVTKMIVQSTSLPPNEPLNFATRGVSNATVSFTIGKTVMPKSTLKPLHPRDAGNVVVQLRTWNAMGMTEQRAQSTPVAGIDVTKMVIISTNAYSNKPLNLAE